MVRGSRIPKGSGCLWRQAQQPEQVGEIRKLGKFACEQPRPKGRQIFASGFAPARKLAQFCFWQNSRRQKWAHSGFARIGRLRILFFRGSLSLRFFGEPKNGPFALGRIGRCSSSKCRAFAALWRSQTRHWLKPEASAPRLFSEHQYSEDYEQRTGRRTMPFQPGTRLQY